MADAASRIVSKQRRASSGGACSTTRTDSSATVVRRYRRPQTRFARGLSTAAGLSTVRCFARSTVVVRTYRPGVTFPYLDGDPQVIDLNHRSRRLLVCLLATALAAAGLLALTSPARASTAVPRLFGAHHRVSPHVIGRHKRRAGTN